LVNVTDDYAGAIHGIAKTPKSAPKSGSNVQIYGNAAT